MPWRVARPWRVSCSRRFMRLRCFRNYKISTEVHITVAPKRRNQIPRKMKQQLFVRHVVLSLLIAGLTRSVLSQQYTQVKIKMIYSGIGWTGVGVSSAGSMVGSVAVIGSPDTLQKYDLNGKFVGTGGVAPSSHQNLGSSSWYQIQTSSTTQTVMEFVAPLNWNNGVLSFQSSGNTQMIYAYGSSNTLGYHAGRASLTVNLAYCLNGANSGDSKCKPDDANYDQVQVLSGGVVKVFTKLF